MDRYPQQLFTAEQAAAGPFCCWEKTPLFRKLLFLYPQALFTTFQACRSLFAFVNNMPFFEKVRLCEHLLILVKIWSIFDNIGIK